MLPYPARRAVFALIVIVLTATQLGLAWAALKPGGWTVWEGLVLLCFAGTTPWSALNGANALIGLLILLFAHPPAVAVLPVVRSERPGRPG